MAAPAPREPAPNPQNALERLIAVALDDPGRHGEIFRKLWESELHVYVPAHPEWVGDHLRRVDEGFTWCVFQDEKGPFAPVFTSEAAALHRARMLPDPQPMIASMPAEVLFAFLNNGRTTVLVTAAGGQTLRLAPGAVASLVAGELTHSRVGESTEKKAVTLRPVPDDAVPLKLRRAIRVFCTQRRMALGVYVFHKRDETTGDYPGNDLHVILWLRGTDNDFYNDFCLMAQRLTPRHLDFCCGVITPEDTDGVAFLQRYSPLWPVMRKEWG